MIPRYFLFCIFTVSTLSMNVEDRLIIVNSTSAFFLAVKNKLNPISPAPPIRHLVILITSLIDYEYEVNGITDETVTLRRPDVMSVTIHCVDQGVDWRCGGSPSGYCLIIHPDTKNVTVTGCRMFGGGILAVDPTPENSTMSLTIRDGLMDGGNKWRLVNVQGVRNVTIGNMTIRNGYSYFDAGGCVLLHDVKGNVTIDGSHIHHCRSGLGGCMTIIGNTSSVTTHQKNLLIHETTYVSLTNTTAQYCTVRFGKGGALYVEAIHTLQMSTVTMSDSMASYEGGCMDASDMTFGVVADNVTLRNCTVQGANQGGCWSIITNYIFIRDSRFADCTAGTNGGCLRVASSMRTELTAVTFDNCRGLQGDGGGIYLDSTIIFVGNSLVLTNSFNALRGGCLATEGVHESQLTNVTMKNCSSSNSGSCFSLYGAMTSVYLQNWMVSQCYRRGVSAKGQNVSAVAINGFASSQIIGMAIEESSHGCLNVSQCSSLITRSSFRRCGQGPVLAYQGRYVTVNSTTMEGQGLDFRCLDIRLAPNGSQDLNGLTLTKCGELNETFTAPPRRNKISTSVGTAIQVSVHASLLRMEAETMLATLSVRQLISFKCIDSSIQSEEYHSLLFPHSLVLAPHTEDQARYDVLSCLVIMALVYGCHGLAVWLVSKCTRRSFLDACRIARFPKVPLLYTLYLLVPMVSAATGSVSADVVIVVVGIFGGLVLFHCAVVRKYSPTYSPTSECEFESDSTNQNWYVSLVNLFRVQGSWQPTPSDTLASVFFAKYKGVVPPTSTSSGNNVLRRWLVAVQGPHVMFWHCLVYCVLATIFSRMNAKLTLCDVTLGVMGAYSGCLGFVFLLRVPTTVQFVSKVRGTLFIIECVLIFILLFSSRSDDGVVNVVSGLVYVHVVLSFMELSHTVLSKAFTMIENLKSKKQQYPGEMHRKNVLEDEMMLEFHEAEMLSKPIRNQEVCVDAKVEL
eukprot:PhF_6_TR40475/c0_g1_i1/m.60510